MSKVWAWIFGIAIALCILGLMWPMADPSGGRTGRQGA
jgi:hypothetical protein